jgi:hypothetical protein
MRAGWWTGYSLLQVASLLVFVRRVTGSFEHAPAAGIFVMVALAASAWSFVLRRTRLANGIGAANGTADMILSASLTITCLLLLSALTFSRSHPGGLAAAWLGVVAAESCEWALWFRRRHGSADARSSAAVGERVRASMAAELTMNEEGAELPADVTQCTTRRRTGDGETIYGAVRIDFAAGQRHEVVHLAFCPPLDGLPDFCIEQSEGPNAAVEVSQSAPYGARLEVKRDSPFGEPASVVLRFEALCRGDGTAEAPSA